MIERSSPPATHGRYLIEPPASPGPAPILVGFHGYGEGADAQLERMRRIPGAERWLLVSIQGLHRFYQRRANQVVASWMTRQDRELAIADNLAYVAAVMDAVAREYPGAPRLVFSGFSQGVAMTFRAAAAASRPIDGVIAAGGDVPPEIEAAGLRRVGRALVCHGTAMSGIHKRSSIATSNGCGPPASRSRRSEFAGGHEWSDEVVQAASAFLRELAP